MGRGLAMSAARRVRLAVSGEPVYTPPTLLKQSSAYDYERLSLSSAESRPTTTRPVRLGGKNRIRIAGLQGLLHTPSNLLSRLWASYGRLRETAKETNVSVYDLFVGNQMLMHVCATPMRSYKKKPPVPIPAPSKPQAVAPKRFRAEAGLNILKASAVLDKRTSAFRWSLSEENIFIALETDDEGEETILSDAEAAPEAHLKVIRKTDVSCAS